MLIPILVKTRETFTCCTVLKIRRRNGGSSIIWGFYSPNKYSIIRKLCISFLYTPTVNLYISSKLNLKLEIKLGSGLKFAKLHVAVYIFEISNLWIIRILQVPKTQVQVQVLKTSYQVQPKYTEYRELSGPLWGFTSPMKILPLPTKKYQIYI